MKKFLSPNGFTIMELMIVIAILGILMSMVFDFWTNRYEVNLNRSQRLAGYLWDTIKWARDSMIIGRWVLTGGTYQAVAKRTIYIDQSWITTYYTPFWSSFSWIENSLKTPFFDKDPLYRLKNFSTYSLRQTASVTYTDLWWWQYSMTGMSNIIINIDQKGIVTFTGSDFDPIVTTSTARAITIDVVYDNIYHTLVFDRATWIITLSKPKTL
jgi:prepilin-type N-terminal cleavage/methylation domain-containing protein